ncbi:MAG: hypothetical protein V1808_01705 [Candidatus Daviesbacteria bacterium]
MSNRSEETGRSYTPPLTDLLPSGSSNEGFLANGQTLDQVLKRDAEALNILGYTASEIADLLEPVTAISSHHGTEYIAPNGKKYIVRAVQYRGWQDCPWEDIKIPPNSSKDIYVKTASQEVRIPGMLPHLIRSHNFFEGGSYRVAPEDIVEMFGVEKTHGSIEKAKQLTL